MIRRSYKLVCLLLVLTMLFGFAGVSAYALPAGESAEGGVAASGEEPSAAQPIPVPAQEEETNPLNIIAHTLALKENTYVKYAVPTVDGNVKMLFWTEAQEDYVYGTQACEATAVYKDTVNGELCSIFQYTAFSDKQMTDVLYARAYTEEDGTYTYGDVDKYSILNYAYNMREDENVDETLDNTLTDLLDRGATAQQNANYKTDNLANEPHSKIHTIDSVLSDGFHDMLHPDSKEITEAETYLLFSGNLTLYIKNSVVMTGYHILESYIYYFEGNNGAKKNVVFDGHEFDRKGHICGDCEFVTLSEGCTYYIVAQVVVYNYYVINSNIYYFGTDGIMKTDTEIDGHRFNESGILMSDSDFVDCGNKVYYVVNNIVVYVYIYVEGDLYLQIGDLLYPTTNYEGNVFESDNDEDDTNNATLGNVTCKAVIDIDGLEIPFTVTSKADGSFSFAHLPMVKIIITFVLENYIDVTINVDISRPQETHDHNVILDKNYSKGLEYEQKEDTEEYCVIGLGSCTDTKLIIPSQYNGLPVTEIADRAFAECEIIISVVLPDSIVKIGEKAFADCTGLEKIEMPDYVEIGKDAFRGSIKIEIIVTHALVFIEEKETSCTVPGNIAYYYCAICDRCYSDPKGTQRIYNVTIPAAHNFVDGECTNCHIIQDEVLITRIESVSYLGKFPLGTLESAIGLPEKINVYTADGKAHEVEVEWELSMYDKSKVGTYTISGHIIAPEFHFDTDVSDLIEATVDITEVMKGTADIVFVLDISGSMGDEIANVKNNIVAVAQEIEEMGVSARWSAVTFSDFADVEGEDSTIIMNGASQWFVSAEDYKKAISKISLLYGGDEPEAAVDGLLLANTLTTRSDARVFYILLTDATYKNNNTYGVSDMNETIDILDSRDVNVSVITTTSLFSTYANLTKTTGGIQSKITGNFSQDLIDSLVPIIYEEVMD